MQEEVQINATPETPVQERPANWEYDIAAECIRKAIDCLKQCGIQSARFKVKFEGWLDADFWAGCQDNDFLAGNTPEEAEK